VHLVLAEDTAVDSVIAALRPGLGAGVPILDHSTNLPARVAQLTDRAQHLRPLPLPPLDLGRALAPRLRPRCPHLSLTRAAHAASSHSSQTQSPCARSSGTSATRPSPHGPHRRAHANSSTSPEPPPLAPPSTLLARDPRRPAGPVVSPAPAPPPQRASNGSPARHRGPIWALLDHLTDRSAATNVPIAVDDGRLRRKSSAWNSYPLRGSLGYPRRVPARYRVRAGTGG